MALSNTAVPIYYGKFRDAVIRGDIPISISTSLQIGMSPRITVSLEMP